MKLLLLTILVMFPQLSETIYTPSLPDIVKDLGTTEELVQFTLSIYFIGFALGVALWGVYSDYYGRRLALLAGIAVYIFASIGCLFSSGIESLLVFRFIQAVGASTGSVVGMTVIRDSYVGALRNKAFSTIGAALAFSPALGPIIGGSIDQNFGWSANFFALVMLGLLLSLMVYVGLAETCPANTQPVTQGIFWGLMRILIKDKRVMYCMAIIGFSNGLIFSYYAEAPFIFIDLLGLSPSQYGSLGLLVTFATLVASFISYKLSAYWSSEKTIALGSLITFIGVFYLWLASLNELSLLTGLPAVVVMFTGIGVMIPNTLSIALVNYKELSGTAASIFGLCYYLMIAALTGLMGVMHDGTTKAMPLYFLCLGGAVLIASNSLRSLMLKGETS